MILILDNYDSFTYNLVQMVGAIDTDIQVVRNDAMTVPELERLNPTHLIISPGPGHPKDAGITEQAIRYFADKIPVLGVCLGHQAICEVYGGQIVHGKLPVHGKASDIHVANGSPIFKGLPPLITGARYHSLIADRDSLPDDILVIAEDSDGVVMAIKHRQHELFGVQFHPESILTPDGSAILRNFVKMEGQTK